MRIKAVVFDLDGTLYESEEYVRQLMIGIRDTLADLLSITAREADELLREVRARLGSITLGLKELGISRSTFYSALLKRLDPGKHIEPRPELLKLFSNLRRMGLKLGCHTNASRALAEKVLEALGVDSKVFDVIITCDDADPKPTIDGYLKILNLLNLKPEEVLYVGDRWRVELEPAKKLGMRTALVSRRLQGDPDIFLRDVMELSEKLGELDC
ncbi:MAG: HAD family hydrolase [Thaumarchaeota archaeon]|nr:HAD family hydrolase [Nitrososphaerota archaeon]